MINDISDLIDKELNKNLLYHLCKPAHTAVIFQNSEIHNIVDFYLNCKLCVYNVITNKAESDVHDIMQGLVNFLIQTGPKVHCILQTMKEKLSVILKKTDLNSQVFIISISESYQSSQFNDEFVNVQLLDICSNFDTRSMIGFLIDHLQIEETKYTSNIFEENRSFFSRLAHTLPNGIIEYNNQVGGHGLLFTEEMKILQFKNIVFKPVQQFPKGRTEILFYEQLFGLNKNDDLRNFQIFVPKYFGLFSNPLSVDNDLCIGLGDVLSNFIHPSIADIKLGQITYEPDAVAGKMAVEKAKYFWREEVGFLFTGIRVFKGAGEDDLFLDRFHGLSLDPDMVYFDGILNFLSGHSDRYSLAQQFIEKLKSLLKWFEHQKYYHFFSSSLLLAYDDATQPDCNTLVKMIDFTHCRASDEKDLNSIFGLKSLISYFDRVQSDK